MAPCTRRNGWPISYVRVAALAAALAALIAGAALPKMAGITGARGQISTLRLRGTLALPGVSERSGALAVDADRAIAYVAAREHGIVVVDVLDAGAPFIKAMDHTFRGSAVGVASDKGRLVVATDDPGLVVYEVSDPASPRLASSLALLGDKRAIAIDGDRAFVAAGNSGLHIVDVTTLERPTRLGSGFAEPNATAIEVIDRFAFIGSGSLAIVDVGNVLEPIVRGRVELVKHPATDLAVVGSDAWVAMATAGLRRIDVRDPDVPQMIVAIGEDERGATFTAVDASGIDVFTVGSFGLRVYDADHNNGPPIAEATQPVDPVDVHYADGLVYVLDRAFGLLIYDWLPREPRTGTPGASPSKAPTGTPTVPVPSVTPSDTPSATPANAETATSIAQTATARAKVTTDPTTVSPTPTRTDTLTPTRTHTPTQRPTPTPSGPGIAGMARKAGLPAQGKTIQLIARVAGVDFVEDSAVVDGSGRYHLDAPPTNAVYQTFRVVYENGEGLADELARWESAPFPATFDRSTGISVMAFDIGPVGLQLPDTDEAHKLPLEFSWRKRTAVEGDQFIIKIIDPATKVTYFESPRTTGLRYLLTAPEAVRIPRESTLSWCVGVEDGLGGVGSPLNCNPVRLEREEGATLQPTVPPTATGTNFPTFPPPTPSPTVAPTAEPRGNGIHGFVLMAGEPAARVRIELMESDLDGSIGRGAPVRETRDDGFYEFLNVPDLAPGQAYHVRFVNDASSLVENRLLLWQTRMLRTYNRGASVDMGDFDIEDVQLIRPDSTDVQDFPIVFRWFLREDSKDNYIMHLRDKETGETVWLSERLSTATSYRLVGLPFGVQPLRQYCWSLLIEHADGGFGVPQACKNVRFDHGDALPTPTSSPTQPSAAHVIGMSMLQRNAAVPLLWAVEWVGDDSRFTILRGLYSGRRGPMAGKAKTGIQVQSLDGTRTQEVRTCYFPWYDAHDPIEQARPPAVPKCDTLPTAVAPHRALNAYLPNLEPIVDGMYSGVAYSNGPVAAIVRTDWITTTAAAMYSSSTPSRDVVVPLVVRQRGVQESTLLVMNPDTSGAIAYVALNFFVGGNSRPVSTRNIGVRSGQSVVIDLSEPHPAFRPPRMPDPFLGYASLVSTVPIVVQSFVNFGSSAKAVSAFEGIPREASSNVLAAPLFRSRQNSDRSSDRFLDTGISVVNLGREEAVVSVVYHGSTPNICAGQSFVHGQITIPANGSTVFYQGPGGEHGLPEGCYGSAVIQTVNPEHRIAAVVQDSQNYTELASAYNAVPTSSGALAVSIPLFRSKHRGLSTGIQVMNVSEWPATIQLAMFNSEQKRLEGICDRCRAKVMPMRSHTFWPDTLPIVPRGTYGSAMVTSDQPIVAIVNDFPLGGNGDAATFNGVPVGR